MKKQIITKLLSTANKFPNKVCFKLPNCSITYEELFTKALKTANAINSERSKSKFIGVFSDRGTIFTYQAIIAIIASGNAYVPLNPKMNDEKLKYIIKHSHVDTIFVDNKQTSRLLNLSLEIPINLVISESFINTLTTLNLINTTLPITDLDSAQTKLNLTSNNTRDPLYMLYTSGTTGLPKGVVVTDANLNAYLQEITKIFQYNEHDIHSHTFDLSFDLSVHDLFCPLTTGGTIIPFTGSDLFAPEKLINKENLTCWFSVPSIGLLLERRRALSKNVFKHLRVSLFCGEALPTSLAHNWALAAQNSTIVNLYGPTEATIAFTQHKFEMQKSLNEYNNSIVPIGKAFTNQKTAILLEDNKLSHAGVAKGELLLSGSQLSDGYWQAPNLNKQKFINNSKWGDDIWYKTGDLVRRDENEILHFCQRLDNQIKFRGYRIELGEIEEALRTIADTNLIAVIAWPKQGPIINGIAAILAKSKMNSAEILTELKKHLPFYMVPTSVHFFNEMPLNINGKIDRNEIVSILDEPEQVNVKEYS